MIPIILSGGSGTRLWPLSRKMYPKQFLSLLHDETMLQRTLQRLSDLEHLPPVVVCNSEHRFVVAEQARQIGIEDLSIILEPCGRNTAPAIAVAAVHAAQKADDPVLLVLTADHEIPDQRAFSDVVRQALPLAEAGNLVTFGIVPTYAATGYGYIRRGDKAGNGYIVDEFVEKPDHETAESYLASDSYYWNSGMFMFRAQAYLDELQKFNPAIVEKCRQAAAGMTEDIGFLRLDEDAFARCEADSIDYAVMEKTDLACVVPMDAGWSDIGSWSSLWEQGEKDTSGNATRGDVLTRDTENSIVHAESRLVATVGVSDLVIVETQDAVLVAGKDKAQEVKKIVEKLALDNREEENFHRIVYRPWGSFDSVDEGEGYKVKRISVKPGARLSKQMHHHRAEHWVVVRGTARVFRDDEIFDLHENESVFIPLGTTHYLENPGDEPLDIIEVQSGSYLGEDDIVRFDDIYGRSDE
ncbi:MAG: mannose-1-phosphate guanylyltransferase/mannose-6-phosphate isomerase [Gammaproteobacteria bacterium]|nr:MAG: mannose-1-phosphate guanylyltransferase/mannose-6-phosphate isomerase [Gammaproteobacteria bacterium]